GSLTNLFYSGNMSIGGTGKLVMSDSINNRIMAANPGGYILTNGAGHTIQGAGNLLFNTGGMVNKGIIIADQPKNPLIIDPDAKGVVNRGKLIARGLGGLQIYFGPFTTSGQVSVAAKSTLNRKGDYTQTGGVTIVNGALTATGLIQLQGGMLKGNGTVSSVNNTGGGVAPGIAAGILHVNGNYTQGAGGRLISEIGGLTAGSQYDQLLITGRATLFGGLTVRLAGGFVPAVGNTFTVLTATGGISGRFDPAKIVLPVLGANSFKIVYTANSVVLKVVAGHPPAPTAKPIVTPEDQAAATKVFPNDPDVGNTHTYAVTTAAAHGKASVNAAGLVTYTPNLNFNGMDSFVVTVTDNTGLFGTVKILVTVTPVNDPPTATSASITTKEDTTSAGVTPSVTDVDIATNGDTHTFTILTQPAHGSANVIGNKLFYTPSLNYNGADSFTY
ncbi:MAG: hypothetical protein D6694_07735, partial [Gammaproteobacteria bacterium]